MHSRINDQTSNLKCMQRLLNLSPDYWIYFIACFANHGILRHSLGEEVIFLFAVLYCSCLEACKPEVLEVAIRALIIFFFIVGKHELFNNILRKTPFYKLWLLLDLRAKFDLRSTYLFFIWMLTHYFNNFIKA